MLINNAGEQCAPPSEQLLVLSVEPLLGGGLGIDSPSGPLLLLLLRGAVISHYRHHTAQSVQHVHQVQSLGGQSSGGLSQTPPRPVIQDREAQRDGQLLQVEQATLKALRQQGMVVKRVLLLLLQLYARVRLTSL